MSNVLDTSSGNTTITLEEWKRYREEQAKHVVQPVPRVRNWDE